ncbi:class I SAM-dependent methyltransferase [Paenibacillus sp. GCM10023248]|uniref:class I SAM-dependent methyltransferase n=1 Tax=Bacillales TaxID=1385 RepID=UPI002378301D|nr:MULTISPECIES: class I SAM-dependent methyltransferase [Bacillales]MDD9267728.1 class I SAM-dependent methyltransferase [Paenibacillus sp. MAHUQ-63]MDR6882188.1 23S rRNA (cytosine1962-C5)-methyltransferase [Bacillus sp. 3255]
MFYAKDWVDYELLDTGSGEKLERWGTIVLRRPDPQIIWPLEKETQAWRQADAHYHRSSSGGGQWQHHTEIPERWTITYDQKLTFYIKPTGFKHTGLFPEQAVNWKWMIEKIQGAKRPIKVLNLFAYTGGASLACAYAGAEVCHVDASKGVVQWAKENLHLSGMGSRPVRFITDDVFKFVQREQRRGSKYDAIIMDPPSYGRGPNGETWKLEEDLFPFIQTCQTILTDNPLFLLINSYTTGISATVLHNILSMAMKSKHGGTISSGEIGLPITHSGLMLPCGILGRWEA